MSGTSAEAIIDSLSNKLISDNAAIRANASEALAKILENLSAEQKINILTPLSDKLIKWLKFETEYTPALRTILTQLSELALSRIRNRQFAESYHILEIFHLINSNQIERSEEIRSAVSDTLEEIASDEILDILLEAMTSKKENEQHEAARITVMMAEFFLNSLLNILQKSQDSSERLLVLNLIAEIGPVAAQTIIERIDPGAPWFYLRNLVRILGRIGREEHAKILEPLLFYGNNRVQREALKGISNIGGVLRDEILLNALSKCDDLFKASVVATLGSLKYRGAIKPLMELFKSKLSVPVEVKIDLQEKICLALGNIGDKEALPFLTEISRQSSFLGFKSYSPAVKSAAVKALGRIMNKAEQ